MGLTRDGVLKSESRHYILKLEEDRKKGNAIPNIEDIISELLDNVQLAFEAYNSAVDRGMKWKVPQRLDNAQIADLILYLYEVRVIDFTGETDDLDREYGLLAIYDESKQLYSIDESFLRNTVREFAYTISKKDIDEILTMLFDNAKLTVVCDNPDLIPFSNCIFNYRTKQMIDYSPEYVFITKYNTAYNPAAKNIVIHNDEDNTDWDVESWMSDLSNDAEIVDLIWHVIGAVLRPNVRWNKSAWFYSSSGNNGKGTLCSLMRNICGTKTCTSVSLSEFAKDFYLERLIGKHVIITDENDVGTFIDKAANLKAIITNDVIKINRKNKTMIDYRFRGFMVQCLNELPRIKDNSNSMYRRQLYIPFDKCFTGQERHYIKDDYLFRKEVLEYVVYKVMNMPSYYSLETPESCEYLLSVAKQINNPVIAFWEEFSERFVWDMLPTAFLYALYCAWYKINYCSTGNIISRDKFTESLKLNATGWEFKSKGNPSSIHHHKMDKPEYLIAEYNLIQWMNPAYRGEDKNIICRTGIRQQYRDVFVRM